MEHVNSQHCPAVSRQGSYLFLALSGICVFLGGLLLSQFVLAGYVFGVLALVASCFGVLVRWPYGAVLIILISSVIPRVSVQIGGWNARPEDFAVLLVTVFFLFRWAKNEKPRIVLAGADYFLAAYVLWNYVSSGLMSPEPQLTLRWALLNNLAILPYLLIRLLVTDERRLRWVFRTFMTVGVAECTYAVASFTSRHLFGTSFGVAVGQYAAGLDGVYGTQYEPNLLGSYSASVAVMLLGFYLLSNRRPALTLAWIIVALSALVVSLSRAALLSFGIVSILLVFLAVRWGLVHRKKLLFVALGLALFVPPIAVTGGKQLAQRFVGLLEGGVEADVETMGRFVTWTVAVEDIWQHPLAGNGTASFQLLADARQLPILGDRPWVANSFVRILHDTGVVGLALFGLLVTAIGKQVRNRIAHGATGGKIIIVLAAGCLVYAIAFMSTDGTMLAFFWVHAGLLASACTVLRRDPAEGVWANV